MSLRMPGGGVAALVAWAAAVVLTAVLSACGRGPSPPAHTRAVPPFPPSGFAAAWRRQGPGETVGPGGLYRFMDGGAEVFLRAGFERLFAQSYTRGSGELDATLYVLRDAKAARTVWDTQGGGGGTVEGLPGPASADRYQLKALLGRCYLVIDSTSGDEGAIPVMETLARHIAQRAGRLCSGP